MPRSTYQNSSIVQLLSEENAKRLLEIDATTATLSAKRCEPTLLEFDDDLLAVVRTLIPSAVTVNCSARGSAW